MSYQTSFNCSCPLCKPNCSKKYFNELLERYAQIQSQVDAEFLSVIPTLEIVIENLEMGIGYTTQGDAINAKIDEWLAHCQDTYPSNWSPCHCEHLKEEFNDLVKELEDLDRLSLYYAQMALETFEQSRELDAKLAKLKMLLAKNCYPKPSCK